MEIKAKNLNVKDGETFTVAGMEFIKFPETDGKVPVVMKNIAFHSEFGRDNNFSKSTILEKLKDRILPKLIEAFGEDALCSIKTDLTTLDGLKCYGTMESMISIPTLDFYRQNAEIFAKHNPKTWWWLATADSAQSNCDTKWILCVSPAGSISIGNCHISVRGVRPFFLLKSSIFQSFEKVEENAV